MRDTIAGKAARYSLAQDCGKCENCLEMRRLKGAYEYLLTIRTAESVPKGELNQARRDWLEAGRFKPCLGQTGKRR